MKPPDELNVLDKHGGFTAEVTPKEGSRDQLRNGTNYTLWRPGRVLKKTTQGVLQSFNENSFYQVNNDVTSAFYKMAGYRWPCCCWFDNKTGERIA